MQHVHKEKEASQHILYVLTHTHLIFYLDFSHLQTIYIILLNTVSETAEKLEE